jgi:hypothetical protein
MRAETAAEQFGLLRAWFADSLHGVGETAREPIALRDSHAADSDGRRAA